MKEEAKGPHSSWGAEPRPAAATLAAPLKLPGLGFSAAC